MRKKWKTDHSVSGDSFVHDTNGYSFGNFLSDIGNQQMRDMLESGKVQAKLRVGKRGDSCETEADRIADEILQGNAIGKPITSQVRHKPDAIDGQVDGETESRIKALDATGRPLSASLRDFFAPRFGIDVEYVRIHTDPAANRLASAIQAKAFVSDNHIVFAQGEYQPETASGRRLIAHELAHVVQNDTSVVHRQQQLDVPKVIRDAYANFNSGVIDMPALARILIPFASVYTTEILAVFDALPEKHRDNLAFAMANNSTDVAIMSFTQKILDRMLLELGKVFNTYSHGSNWAQRDRIHNLLFPELTSVQKEAERSLVFLRTTYDNNLSGSVGDRGNNAPVDVQLVARGLNASRGYAVPAVSVNRGICTPELISLIRRFQADVEHARNPDGVVSPKGTTLRMIFNKANNSYASGLQQMYGRDASELNAMIEGDPLATWNRADTRNARNNLFYYTIDSSNFLDRATYEGYIRALSRHQRVGVAAGSNIERTLDLAARAAREVAFFDALTRGVNYSLVLSDESIDNQRVSTVLKDRLRRYHRFMSAVGLFRGNMTGAACRLPSYAHRICIPHVVRCNAGIRPAASKQSIRNNLINVYNGTAVAGGRRLADGSVVDSDGYSWARQQDFVLDEEGRATAMNDATWFTHISRIQPTRSWNTNTAEGYRRGDSRRFPLGLNASPGRSNHITGDAIDINKDSFTNMNDAVNDLVALYFGIMRPVGGEQWHFECTNLELSASERALIRAGGRETVQ